MAKEKKQVSKKVKIIGNVIFFSVIAIIVTFSVWNFVDIRSGYKYPIFGLRKSVIVSESMATVNDANTYITPEMKQIKKYDVVTTQNYKNFDEIKQYDVATYFTGSKNLICHRVIDKYVDADGKQYIVFRGDANSTNDAPVSYDLIRGKVISVSKQTGHVVAFVQSPFFFLAIFGVIFFVALGIFIADRDKEKKLALAEEESETPETPTEPPEEQAQEEQTSEPQEEEIVEEQEETNQEQPEESSIEETPVEEPTEEQPAEEQPETEEPQEEAQEEKEIGEESPKEDKE